MKKLMHPVLALAILLTVLLAGCSTALSGGPSAIVTSTAPVSTTAAVASTVRGTLYKDGVYQVKCANDSEGYYVMGSVTISGGKISAVNWAIYDSNRSDKKFDKNYETVFAGNDTYIQQCRDNLKGMENFIPELIDKQDINEVDAISGATWSYKKFELLVKEALKQAAGN